MGFNNKFFKTPFAGMGLDLYYEQQPYSAGNPTYTPESKAIGSYKDYNNYIKYGILSRASGKDTSLFVQSNLNVNNDELVNKTSLIDIINYLQKWDSTYVEFADFAYLKNIGVYPTNRLIIVRRFSNPTPNNLYKVKDNAMSTLISWLPDGEPFLSIGFGEQWESVTDLSITDILSDFASDFAFKKDISQKKFGGGLDVLPLPGLTEGLQENIRNQLGLTPDDPEYNKYNLPAGNPNLIKEASIRGLVSPEKNGSGLNGKFNIKFSTEYELKFINGVDPSLVYLDIIQNALVFGTSKSINILNTNIENATSQALKGLLSGDFKQVGKIIGDIINGIGKFLKDKYDEYQNKVNKKGFAATTKDFFIELGKDVISFEVSKYRIRLIGVLQMMTGAPSGYYHVTIGNPKKPILSSGDMIPNGNVTLTLGPVLSYNDLPSTIKIEFELTSARNLGGQEIFDRLNTGQSRTYFQPKRSYFDEFFGGTSSGGGTNDQTTKSRQKRFIDYTTNAVGKDQKDNPGPGVGQITTDSIEIQEVPIVRTQGSTNQV